MALPLLLVMIAWAAREAGAAPAASAAPQARQRVVLADPDPELRHAMEQALAPWRLEVVIEGLPPADAAMAEQRADADTARFVVWREAGQLVVYDRELGTTERRDSRAGVLDAPTAAAAALTIKTMMRLPPPPPDQEIVQEIIAPAPPAIAEPGAELRFQAGGASRISRGDRTRVTAQFGGAALIRPWHGSGWRFGVAGDTGTSASVSRAGFKGTWREWGILGVASWTYARDAWEIEPHAGFGLRHGVLDGQDANTPRREAITLAAARVGMWARRRIARWTFGAVLALDANFGTQTYKRAAIPPEIFQVPDLAVELGAVIAVDL